MKTKFKIGAVYWLRFHDHCVQGDDPILCEVFGRVVKQTEEFVTLSWWNVVNSDEETKKNNREVVNIVKSTIKKKKQLLAP